MPNIINMCFLFQRYLLAKYFSKKIYEILTSVHQNFISKQKKTSTNYMVEVLMFCN
jgi:hypothetical protein